MSDINSNSTPKTETTPETPKKKSYFTLKNLLWLIAGIFIVVGIDYYTLNLVSGDSVEAIDSTIVIASPIDTIISNTHITK